MDPAPHVTEPDDRPDTNDRPASTDGADAVDTSDPADGAGVGTGPRREVALAIDINGSRMTVGLATRKGEIVERDQVALDHEVDGERVFAQLAGCIDRVRERAAERLRVAIAVAGVSCTGPAEPNLEAVSPVDILSWRQFPLRRRLHEHLGVPVYGDLDAKALALAEGWLGAAKGHQSFIGLVISTGIGGGIVLDGQLLDGAHGTAGLIGHVIVEPNGRRCSCGAKGCLESEASGAAIAAITGRAINEPSYEIMQRTGRLVGLAVSSVCNLLDVDLAVVGGTVAEAFGATFFLSAQEAIDEHSRLSFSRGARITPVRLGDRGPLIAASALAWRGMNRASHG